MEKLDGTNRVLGSHQINLGLSTSTQWHSFVRLAKGPRCIVVPHFILTDAMIGYVYLHQTRSSILRPSKLEGTLIHNNHSRQINLAVAASCDRQLASELFHHHTNRGFRCRLVHSDGQNRGLPCQSEVQCPTSLSLWASLSSLRAVSVDLPSASLSVKLIVKAAIRTCLTARAFCLFTIGAASRGYIADLPPEYGSGQV